MHQKISNISKGLLLVASILLIISMFLPLWLISLDAPQYPEGLEMKIYANKIGGNVDIINGLNHYIGMQTLHAENFIEFSILRYILASFALFCLISIFINKKRFLYITFWAFVIFGVVAMVDFWRWEYNYGHNLDPNAAIVVPGMAYQPPLIGFKQLLNFGAYAMPDIGGWVLFSAGIMLLIASFKESKIKLGRKFKLIKVLFFSMIVLPSCIDHKPQAIKLNKDNCNFCEMTISNSKFAAEIITQKGRIHTFDDMHCLMSFCKENNVNGIQIYISNYEGENELIPVLDAFFLQDESFHSPMGGNFVAFKEKKSADFFANKLNIPILKWNEIYH